MRAVPKKLLGVVLKVAFSAAMLAYVVHRLAARDGADEVWARLGDLSWGWWVAAAGMQLTAIGFAVVRWRLLLEGQGILAPWRFLVGSFFIGRFWGAFTPGGLGLDGWRLYDVATRTQKVARATAVTGVEKVLGQLAFGLVVMGGSVWGFRFIGAKGVLLVNGFFVVLVAVGMTLLARPQLFRTLARMLPAGARTRVQTLVDAICAYHGRAKLLATAVLLGVGVHAFNNLIYVCAARAVGVDLSLGVVFFGSSLQIMATLVPASINGIGLRETAAVALYTSAAVGLSMTEAVLIPWVGFAAEMAVSAVGLIPFLLRRGGYRADIEVRDADREEVAHQSIAEVPEEQWPRTRQGLTIGAGAGLLAGVLVGLAEGAAVVATGGGRVGLGVLTYGAVAYGLACMVAGAGAGWALAWSGRVMQRAAVDASLAYARLTGAIVATFAFALSAFRIRRDVFHEELAWKSGGGLLLLVGCFAAAVLLYVVVATSLQWLLRRRVGRLLIRSWGLPAMAVSLVIVAAGVALWVGQPAEAAAGGSPHGGNSGPGPSASSPNVLMIVVDTLRADHLPAYGYEAGTTPHLDAFAEDAIRFDQFFANASWTRPSFASMLTGRYASNHGVMSKADQLPDPVVTLPEALRENGYRTAGFVTNYNVAPYFNFQQGFDTYRYLEPDYVLGADDAAAKLLLVQALRRVVERVDAIRGQVKPGKAYRDAETVNHAVHGWLKKTSANPWFLFVAYMDPHDPYFVHPYSGKGYGRAAHPRPKPEEAEQLRALYDGEIEYWDEHFGKLIATLKRQDLYDDMIILVTSDHGEEFHDHGGFWHGTTLYDEQVHVPLFVKLPQSRRGGTDVRHWTQSVDLMPTLLRELDIDVPSGVQGGDLFAGADVVYAEESHEGNVLEALRERRGTEERKLLTANPGNPRGLAPVEFFRVDEDPEERENLAPESPDEVVELTEALIEQGKQARAGALKRQHIEMDEEAKQRLRSLGYAE